MIDVSVGQQHCIDISRTKRKCAVVQSLEGLLSLKEPTINEHA